MSGDPQKTILSATPTICDNFPDVALPSPSDTAGFDPEKTIAKEELAVDVEEIPPDGGYGWVVAVCQFFCNAATFGIVGSFGVYLSFYRKSDYFPGATDLDYAFIGGLMVGIALLISPISSHLSNKFGFRGPMLVGALIDTLSQIFAAFSTTIWELFLTQGIMMGIGVGLIFIPTLPILAQWFTRRRGLALGIAQAGAGGGAVFFSLVTRATIQNLGLRWAFIINALICFSALMPAVCLIKTHSKASTAKIAHIGVSWLVHPGFFWVWFSSLFALLGYCFAIISIPTYGTAGLGLSQSQGANLQVALCLAQMVFRPIIGHSLDTFGRINGASFFTFLAGLSCLLVWMFARSYPLLIFFCVFQGATGGAFWSSTGPVTAEVVGVQHMASALSIFWIIAVIPNLFAEPIGLSLVDYAQNQLQESGPQAYMICIGFSGGCFIFGSIALLGAKRYLQGNWKIWQKT